MYVEHDDGRVVLLKHHVYHSPDGHSWGYEGSGPTELAKDILWDVLGHEPSSYHWFMRDVISQLPQDKGFALKELDVLLAWSQWEASERR